ncbi:MAG: dihydroorotate dehydrogenase electron transfer subunit [Nitrospirae bacterium]|nr:dihydroorotate dehydrogenase electron transfer subunit [Nitrospirota bacterium]
MSRYFKAEIRENRPVHTVHNLLTLNVPLSMPEPRPGQFFMVEVNKGTDPLLKRAFSLFRKTAQGVQILYRIRGKGTEILKDMKEGSEIEVLGPLGTCYPLPSGDTIPLIIAGGIGIASVFSLVEQLSGRATVFYGARTKNDLLMHKELKGFAKEILVSTDDGSAGQKGTIADSLSAFLSRPQSPTPKYRIYACGPHPLLKIVSEIAREFKISANISMEEHMACGIGACLGCVVRTRDGYTRVCKEGPVFEAREIVW